MLRLVRVRRSPWWRSKRVAGGVILGLVLAASAILGPVQVPDVAGVRDAAGIAEAKSSVSIQVSVTAPASELRLEDVLFLSAMAAFWGMDVDVIAQYYSYYPSGILVQPVPQAIIVTQPAPMFTPAAYVQFASSYYCVPESQVWAWVNMGIPAPELTMCLNIAARARVSPSMVIRLRRSGASWESIARRYRIPRDELSRPVVSKAKYKKWK